MTAVRLEQFPTELFAAFDEATEGLFREFMLLTSRGGEPFTAADVAVASEAKAIVTQAALQPDVEGTVVVEVAADASASFAVLQAVLDHANRLAHDEQMLALPVLPEIAAVRNWICDQVSQQLHGVAATPWSSLWAASIGGEPGRLVTAWPGTERLDQTQAWLVGDRRNRIIGATQAALDLLGWDASLLGERIIAVIPPELRERHVAAFTRGTVSEQHRLLGQGLPLQALTRDGRAIPITLTLTTSSDRGVPIYLARLEAR